jgi:predicted nucleic acid-binding protein
MPRRVYIDSGVLILAATAQETDICLRAIAELDKPDTQYLYSRVVELETVPQPTIHGREEELQFMRQFFAEAEYITCDEEAQAEALAQACTGRGLAAADALHVACALRGGADEIVTTEAAAKPLPQAVGITVRTITV